MSERKSTSVGHYEEQIDNGFLGLKFVPEIEQEFQQANLQGRRAVLNILWVGFLVYQCVLLALDIAHIEPGLLMFHLLLRVGLIVLPTFGAIMMLARGQSPRRVHWVQSGALLLVGLATLVLATQPNNADSHQAVFTALFYLVFLFVLAGIPFRLTLLVSLLLIVAALVIEKWIDAVSLYIPENGVFWVFCFFLAGMVHLYHREYTIRWDFLKNARLRGCMERDAQTSLYSRCSFDAHLERVWRQAMRDHLPIALALIDSEDMRNLLDVTGISNHREVELLMRAVADVLNTVQKRPLDMVARLDETRFVVLWYGAHPEMVRTMAADVKKKLAELMVQPFATREIHPLSVEIGVAVAVPDRGDDEFELINLAQEALLLAGQDSGGNIVVRHFDRSWPADLTQMD